MRNTRDKEGNRQIPVSGREREDVTKQESRQWERQTGLGQGQQGQGFGQGQQVFGQGQQGLGQGQQGFQGQQGQQGIGQQQDWESVKGIGDQRPEYGQREGFGQQREGFGQTGYGVGQTGSGQERQQEGLGLQRAGMGQTGQGGNWESEKGSSEFSSDTGKTRNWDQDREVDQGYEKESDYGQKSREYQKLQKQEPEHERGYGKQKQQEPEHERGYGDSSYQQKPYQELEQGKARRIGFEDQQQPDQQKSRRVELEGAEQQQQQGKGTTRRVGIDDQPSHSDWGRGAGLTDQQDKTSVKQTWGAGLAGQEKQQTCVRNEPCTATGVCPKEKENEPCPQKQPCSTHSKICPKEKENEPCPQKQPCSTHASKLKEKSKEGQHDEAAAAAGGTGGGLLQRLGLKKKEGEEEEGREAKDDQRQQRRMEPKMKEEIQQCKDKRFTDIMTTMQKTKCKALLDSHKPLVTVSDTTSVNEALVTLIENDLSSAPIIGHDGEFMGFIDMLGLTKFTMSLQGKQLQQQPLQGRQQQQQKQPSLARSEEWKNETVGGLLKKDIICSDHHQLLGSSTLYEAFELMARSRHHRIALTGKRNEVIGVLTQSMMIEWLYDNKKDLGGVADILVLRVRPYTFLATVKEDEPAFHAFDLMTKQHLSGLAVVNRDGKLVDGISVRDLRGVCSGSGCDFSPLSKSVKQFKKIVTKAKNEFKWTGKLVVKNEDNFQTVLEKLVKQRAHRVFVIDREEKPVDVITGSSIMMMILHCAFPPEHWGPLT